MAGRAALLLLVAAVASTTGGDGRGEPSCSDTPTDCTNPLQAALNNSSASAVTFPAGTAITRPLFLHSSNRVVRFRAGAVLLAMRWQYVGVTDRMLTVSEASNVSLLGTPGSTSHGRSSH